MRNKEKAQELANCQNCIDVALQIKNVKVCNPDERPCERYKNFVKMAEWKEQQMIDKATEWIRNHIPDYYGYGKIFPEIIEDFRKDMEN